MADIVLIAVIALFACFGARRGFVKSLLGVVSTFVSLILTSLIYRPVSQAMYNSGAGDSVKEFIRGIIEEKIQTGVQIPMIEQTVETASMLVMNVASFILVILISKIVVSAVIHTVNIAAKLPVIKQANKLLGMFAGILTGILVCYIAIGIIAALGAEGNISLMKDSIENSYLAVTMYDNNLITNILSNFIN